MSSVAFDPCFWLSMAGLVLGFISGISVYCLRSKCSKCTLCYGLVTVNRDVAGEITIEKEELERGGHPTARPTINKKHRDV